MYSFLLLTISPLLHQTHLSCFSGLSLLQLTSISCSHLVCISEVTIMLFGSLLENSLHDAFLVDAAYLLQFGYGAVLYKVVRQSKSGDVWGIAMVVHPL